MSALKQLRAKNAVLGRIAPEVAAAQARTLFLTPRKGVPRDWEREAERSGTRERTGSGLSVLRFPGTGKRVLAMHGWEGRATQWGPLVARMGEGFEVIAPDAPAHGASPGTEAHPVAFAEAILETDRELGPFFAVIGHSMGGGSAAVALSQGLRAERAVLIAAPADIHASLRRFAAFVGLPDKAGARFVKLVERRVGVPAKDISIEALRPRAAVETLVLHDRGDREIPFTDGEAIARAWAGTLEPTDGLGHRRILRDAKVHDRIVAFLSAQ
ncbi:MAG: alpha/beta hydrolase [Myxococcota bacterium]